MARHIKTDGTIVEVTPANGTDFKLQELQPLVGGYIEIVRLGGGLIMVANEEGMMLNLPDNFKASALAAQPIVGDVLVCRNNEVR